MDKAARRDWRSAIGLALGLAALPLMNATPYAEEVLRTKPDCIVYRPSAARAPDAENQQIIGTVTASGHWLLTWTSATHENNPDQHVVISRSEDRGRTWSPPQWIDGASAEQQAGPERGKYQASWPFFVAAPALGRLYLFYNKNTGITDARDDTTGILRFRYSEDEGRTWSQAFDHLRIGRGAIDHPDAAMPVNFVTCFQSLLASDGVPLASLTRWGSGSPHLLNVTSEVWFLRFENILTERDPAKLVMTTWPDAPHGLQVPHPFRMGMSVAQEAATVPLPDGRLFTVMRTLQGSLFWSMSRDNGRSWASHWTDYGEKDPLPVFPLRTSDDGPLVHSPIVCSPIFEYAPGKYFLIYYNNDGYIPGARHPTDYQVNRREAWIVCGIFSPATGQPVVFGQPRLFATADGTKLGHYQRIEPVCYPSYFRDGEDHWLWYSDRKHFVLGKKLNAYLE
jgi:hypothetical protein